MVRTSKHVLHKCPTTACYANVYTQKTKLRWYLHHWLMTHTSIYLHAQAHAHPLYLSLSLLLPDLNIKQMRSSTFERALLLLGVYAAHAKGGGRSAEGSCEANGSCIEKQLQFCIVGVRCLAPPFSFLFFCFFFHHAISPTQ